MSSFKIGNLISVDPKNTLFWKNSEEDFTPNFENAIIPDNSLPMTGVIVGSDFTFIYVQILSNERIFWVSESSLSIINIQ